MNLKNSILDSWKFDTKSVTLSFCASNSRPLQGAGRSGENENTWEIYIQS